MLKGEMNAAMELLLTSSMSISEISACFNYSSQFYFSRVFKKYYGVSPQQARSGNALKPRNAQVKSDARIRIGKQPVCNALRKLKDAENAHNTAPALQIGFIF